MEWMGKPGILSLTDKVRNFHQFFGPWARPVKLSPSALDPKLGEELWNWCEEQVAMLG